MQAFTEIQTLKEQLHRENIVLREGIDKTSVVEESVGTSLPLRTAASSAFLLFGMALIYADLGTMELTRMAELSAARSTPTLLLPGIVLIFTGIGFKLGVVPFRLWTPDIYEGAPAPVTGFIATRGRKRQIVVIEVPRTPRAMREKMLAGNRA
jgi:hypothetical protein